MASHLPGAGPTLSTSSSTNPVPGNPGRAGPPPAAGEQTETGSPATGAREEVVRAVARRNQQWVEGARGLSPALVTGLLRWSGAQLDGYLSQVDLTWPSSVCCGVACAATGSSS